MILKDNIIYAGITTEKGIELFESIEEMKTGYVFKRVTDGQIVGNKVILKNEKEINMYIEVEEEASLINEYEDFIEEDGIIYAGVTTKEGIEIFKSMENPYTGKRFIRIHDGLLFGNQIQLGNDYSYRKTLEGVRKDLSSYYAVVDDTEDA